MFETTKNILLELRDILLQLPDVVYTAPCPLLSDASIGQHTRHVVEMYLVLLNGYQSGHVCYDDRPRNKKIEEKVTYAAKILHKIAHNLLQADKKLLLTHQLNGNIHRIPTSYNRELMYNLEHTIHHEALLRVAIADFTRIVLPTSFGVAPSTLKFRDQCAQ